MSWDIVAAVRGSEWIAVVFFAHIALATWIRPLPRDRRLTAGLGSLALAAIVVAVSRLEGWIGRDWAPAVYLLAGYYLSGRTFTAPMPRVEAWLIEWDRRVLGDPAAVFAKWPRWTIGLFDAAYIGCFLLVPAGFAALLAAGRVDLADRYWTMVMGAEMGSFAALPYLQTRPPWVIERLAEVNDGGSPRPSVMFMKHATTGANTLPSGHAAGSMAVALAVIPVLPLAGAVLLVLALAIAIAAVVTRGHYVVDVVAGVLLALGIWLVTNVVAV
jgi:membrane-associated phospholipid phosphatase